MTGLWLKGMENRIPLCQRELRRPWSSTKCPQSHCTLIGSTLSVLCVWWQCTRKTGCQFHQQNTMHDGETEYKTQWDWTTSEGGKEEKKSCTPELIVTQPFCTAHAVSAPTVAMPGLQQQGLRQAEVDPLSQWGKLTAANWLQLPSIPVQSYETSLSGSG